MKKLLFTYCLFLFALVCVQHRTSGKATPVMNYPSEAILTAQMVNIYPNPAIDDVFLKFQDPIAQQVTLEIRSVIGNKLTVTSSIENSDLIKIDISNLTAGHYYVIITHDGEKTLKKFIKKG